MSQGYKECVFKHLLNTALNWTFFLRWTTKSTCQSGQYFDASIVLTFLKMWMVGSWFMRMVFTPCVNTVYSGICLKIFLIICTKFEYFMYLCLVPHSSVCMTHIWMHGMYVYMCMCVCMYICSCVFVCIYVHVCLCVLFMYVHYWKYT